MGLELNEGEARVEAKPIAMESFTPVNRTYFNNSTKRLRKMVDYQHCEYCGKTVDPNDLVAIPKSSGSFQFAHRGDCAKALRESKPLYQITIDDVSQEIGLNL